LKAQSGENSQLFMENSISQNNTMGNQQLTMMSQGAAKPGQALMPLEPKPKITVNLMDVSFLEQNLQSILEVSNHSHSPL